MIDSCEKVVVAVSDDEGVQLLVDYLIEKAQKGNVPSAVLLNTFVKKAQVCPFYSFALNFRVNIQVSFADIIEEVLPGVLQLYASESDQVA